MISKRLDVINIAINIEKQDCMYLLISCLLIEQFIIPFTFLLFARLWAKFKLCITYLDELFKEIEKEHQKELEKEKLIKAKKDSSKLETMAPLCPGVVGFLLIRLNVKHLQIYL